MSALSYTPLINGVSYSWSNLVVSFLNNIPIGITSISYNLDQQKDAVYGAGVSPVAKGYGNKTYSASITLQLEEQGALMNIAPNGDLTEIPAFDIIVSYSIDNPSKIRTDILKGCEFKNAGTSANQNDLSLTLDMQLFVSHITFNV